VGKGQDGEDGEFPDLLTALKELTAGKHEHVCLCLLPGDHEVAGDALRDVLQAGVVRDLEIGGRGARIVTGAGLVFEGLARISLRDLAIEARDGRALVFLDDPDEPEAERMRVDLIDVTVTWSDAPPNAELIVVRGCGQVSMTGSDLAVVARSGVRLRDVLPSRVGMFFERAAVADPAALQVGLEKLLALDDGQRAKLADTTLLAVDKRPDLFTPERADVVRRFVERLKAGAPGMPTGPQLAKLRIEWAKFTKGFESERSWPAAVVFQDTPADTVIRGCHIRGGITLRAAGRSLADEVTAESPFRVHHVATVPAGSGRLQIDGNVLDWMALQAEAAKALAGAGGDIVKAELRSVLFAELLVTGNTFRDGPQVFLATAATVAANVFEIAVAGDAAPRVGFVASGVASATGNLGPERAAVGAANAELVVHGDDRAEAGNARLTIV
jgi:hypothetical protein